MVVADQDKNDIPLVFDEETYEGKSPFLDLLDSPRFLKISTY